MAQSFVPLLLVLAMAMSMLRPSSSICPQEVALKCYADKDTTSPQCVECLQPCSTSSVKGAKSAALYKRSCYYIVENSTLGGSFTYSQAAANCKADGANIVSIHSESEFDFLNNLIAQTKPCLKCGLDYWTGLQLTRDPCTNIVTNASWADGSPVNYGNPVPSSSTPTSPPWERGQPNGPDPKKKNCRHKGKCVNIHGLADDCEECGCRQFQTGVLESSNCNEEHNGYICKGCPFGWYQAPFNGHCYKAFVSNGSQQALPANFDQLCGLFNATAVSISTQEENDLVLQLVRQTGQKPPGIYIGLRLTHRPGTENDLYAPITSLKWTDGSSIVAGQYGYSDGTLASSGINPWAATGTWRAQPDNAPPEATCVLMWITDPAAPQPGRWDDAANCARMLTPGTVCEYVP